jgi:acyl-CoA hydrolase
MVDEAAALVATKHVGLPVVIARVEVLGEPLSQQRIVMVGAGSCRGMKSL